MTTCPNGHVVFESDSDCRQCGWSPLPAAGWYPDVTNDGGERYWDGTQWTDHFRNLLVEPASEEVASPQAEPVPEEEIVDSAQIESENPALTEEVATTARLADGSDRADARPLPIHRRFTAILDR